MGKWKERKRERGESSAFLFVWFRLKFGSQRSDAWAITTGPSYFIYIFLIDISVPDAVICVAQQDMQLAAIMDGDDGGLVIPDRFASYKMNPIGSL